MKYVLFLLTFVLQIRTTACDEKSIICRTVCLQDGDEIGIVIKDKCYCANQRDLSQVITRVPQGGGQLADKKVTPNYFQ